MRRRFRLKILPFGCSSSDKRNGSRHALPKRRELACAASIRFSLSSDKTPVTSGETVRGMVEDEDKDRQRVSDETHAQGGGKGMDMVEMLN